MSLILLCLDWIWEDRHEKAWLILKRRLMSFPVLHTFDPKRQSVMYTDASKLHVEAVLCQIVDEANDVIVTIAFITHGLFVAQNSGIQFSSRKC